MIQRPETLGADVAKKVLETEAQMYAIEDESRGVRAFSEQAVAVAIEGDIVQGEESAANAAGTLDDVENQVEKLCWPADQARAIWAEFRRRLNLITTSASTTAASLEFMVAQARRSATLAHTYEK